MNLRRFLPQRPMAWLLVTCFFLLGDAASARETAPAPEAGSPVDASGNLGFRQLDINRDGFLSREETRAIRDFDHAFTEADDNRDNRLDGEEFAKAQAIYERQRLGRVIGDGVITAKIKAALLRDPLVSTADVNVATYRGTVQLSGSVYSEQQVRRAMEVAAGVDGVIEVRNDLVVKS